MATPPKLDQALHSRVLQVESFLKTNNVERDEDIDLLMLLVISGVDGLFLGDPGTGKTYMIELLVNHCLADMRLFSHLFAKDQSADEVLGPRDIMSMKAGKISRLTDGYLPDSHVGYADEIFKASPPMLNPLLDLLANRILKMGGTVKDCKQLIAIIMSSNELPDREDLMAFRDRIGVTKFVAPVRTPEGRRAVTDLQLNQQLSGVDTTGLVPLTLDDIVKVRSEMNAIEVPDAIREMMVEAQQKWMEAGHPPSQRRIGQMWRLIKGHAYLAARTTVVADDLLPCQHAAWNHPDHAASAREVVLSFASVFTRHANRLKEALEPVRRSLEELRTSLDATQDEDEKDAMLNKAYKLMRELRGMSKEAREQIQQGKAQGQDVSMLETTHQEIEQWYGWANNAMTGATTE